MRRSPPAQGGAAPIRATAPPHRHARTGNPRRTIYTGWRAVAVDSVHVTHDQLVDAAIEDLVAAFIPEAMTNGWITTDPPGSEFPNTRGTSCPDMPSSARAWMGSSVLTNYYAKLAFPAGHRRRTDPAIADPAIHPYHSHKDPHIGLPPRPAKGRLLPGRQLANSGMDSPS